MRPIPPNIADVSSSSSSADAESSLYEERERAILKLEERALKLETHEIYQRVVVRWVAVGIGIFVILMMLAILGHALHHLIWFGPILRGSAAFSVAIIVAPAASITMITIALFVGAFKKFEDKDADRAANGIGVGMNLLKGS